MTGITVRVDAAKVLEEMAEAWSMTPRELLEALLHYCGSIYKRPGSWEANIPFAMGNYVEDGHADRWF
jgi:hypothetical protein